MKKVIFKKGENKVPIKLWLENLEEGALKQAVNLSNLPFAFKHIAIMPDSHQGYGMPIGGVLATKNVVIPNAVGVDIGCFDKDTEYLTPTGWKKFDSYNGDLIMQFNPKTHEGVFVKPLRYIKEKCDEFISIQTKYGVNQVLSKDHRCLVYKYDRGYKFNQYGIILAEDLMKKHNFLKNGFRHRFLTSFILNTGTSLGLTDEEIRVCVMLSADGHIDKNRIVLQFKKSRKIKRAIKLLEDCGIKYNKSKHNNGVFRISFLKDKFKKGLEHFWFANKNQLEIIVDESFNWDGNIKEKCFYTRRKQEADFMHYAISAIGKRAVLRSDKHYKDGRIDYRVFQYDDTKIGINGSPKSKIKTVKSKDGYKYSFTVPSSFLVVRRGSNVFVTGNCGMCAVKTSLTNIDKDTLQKIVNEIKEVIPVGFNKHKENQNKDLMPYSHLEFDLYNGSHDLREYLDSVLYSYDGSDTDDGSCIDSIFDYLDDVNELKDYKVICTEYKNALKSLGTLGGGNHFIEIQKSNDGFIWIMIHSGSRNLGYKVAKYYNEIAKKLNKKWFSNVDYNVDLAFLPLDTEIGKDYMTEMKYCVEYAKANRMVMMDRICKCFGGILKEFHIPINFGQIIDIAHNYASLENHFGQNVIVHRKGATSAKNKEIGIIPGSQGSKSYIVIGKGNPESFMSCSHGSGRIMSRTQAKKTFDLNEEIQKMDKQGIIHNMNKNNLDECSSAYKDIDVVMENQKDLVEIKVELKPLAVIKG